MCVTHAHTFACMHTHFTYSIILALTGKCGFWTGLNKVKQRLKENSSSVCAQLPFSCLTFHHKSFSGRQICKGIRPSVSVGPQKPHMMWRPLQRTWWWTNSNTVQRVRKSPRDQKRIFQLSIVCSVWSALFAGEKGTVPVDKSQGWFWWKAHNSLKPQRASAAAAHTAVWTIRFTQTTCVNTAEGNH